MTENSSIVLAAAGITKKFGNHTALDGVDIAFHRGEVHALLGENGAGKSTLIKILTGAYIPDGGSITVDGEVVNFTTPQQAQSLGIGTVYQEVNLLPNMTVIDNLFIGRQPTNRFGLVDKRRMERESREILTTYGLDIDVKAELSTFSVAVQQIIAIARAVELSGKVLILDEPTASLDRSEVEKLFGIVRQLRDRGLAIVFITHFLDQVFELSDRVTVLRNGLLVGTQAIASLDRTSLVRMMLGKDLAFHHPDVLGEEGEVGETLMEFQGFGLSNSVRPFDLKIHRGEVVGIAGLLGSGRTEMARLMFGIDQADSGAIKIDGASRQVRNPREAVELGFGFCPEDRKIDGIFGDLSVRENIVIAMQARLYQHFTLVPSLTAAENLVISRADVPAKINWSREREALTAFMQNMPFQVPLDVPVGRLAAGEKQKLELLKQLYLGRKFLILDEPTRGIDVGAHAEIVRMISRLREDGLALVVISSELDEIVSYSSRVVVMRDRKMVAELHGADITPGVIVQTIAAQPAEVEA